MPKASGAKRPSPSKSWVFTLNNWTESELGILENWKSEVSKITVSEEIGENETQHLQGAVTFKRAYRLKQLKKLLPRAHWEVAKCKDASLYCMKADSKILINQDNRVGRGTRTDLKQALACKSVREVTEQFPEVFVKYHTGIEKLFNKYSEPPMREGVEIIWHWGPTGKGKTYDCFKQDPTAKKVLLSGPANAPFLNGYVDHEIVIFDDFRASRMNLPVLLELTDPYPMEVNVKGTYVHWRVKKLYITSPYPPDKIYTEEDTTQLVRRCTLIKEYK